MKKIIYSLLTAVLLAGACQETVAQDRAQVPTEKTRRFLLRYLGSLDSASTPESKETILKGIEMVANASKTDWISQYHAAFQNAIIASEKKDTAAANKMISKAEGYIKTALALNENESEIVLLSAMIQGIKIGIHPELGATLGPEVMKGYAKAKKLNPENPRVYLVMGESYTYMPEEAGGGMKLAKATLEIARAKFEKDTHEDAAWPTWGKDRTIKLLAEIDSKK